MNSAVSRNSFAYLGSRTSSPVCHGGTLTLKRRCVRCLCSLFWSHTQCLPCPWPTGWALTEPHLVRRDARLCPVLRDPDPTVSVALCRKDRHVPHYREGWPLLPGKGMSSNGMGSKQARQQSEGRIKLGSQWELWCFPFWILYQVLRLPGALADSCP